MKEKKRIKKVVLRGLGISRRGCVVGGGNEAGLILDWLEVKLVFEEGGHPMLLYCECLAWFPASPGLTV